MGVLTTTQLYCIYKYDFKYLDEDWNIIYSNWFLEPNKHWKAKAKWLEQSAGGNSLWNILMLMHEVIQCYWEKLMNPEMVKVLFEPVTRRCSLMAYSGWTKPNNLSPIARKTVKTGENAWPNGTANVSPLQMWEWGNWLGLSWGLMGFVDDVLTGRRDRWSASTLNSPSMLSLKEKWIRECQSSLFVGRFKAHIIFDSFSLLQSPFYSPQET